MNNQPKQILPWKPRKRQQYKSDYSDYNIDRTFNPATAFSDYDKTGEWKGYEAFKKPTLDYSYIQQIASTLSAKHNVTVKKSDKWSISLKTKTLEYNPLTLINGTKAEVLECLLHEIGHLRHTKEYKGKEYSKKYPFACHQIINLFEDFRIDAIMKKSYPTADEIYKVFIEKTKERSFRLGNNLLEKYIAELLKHYIGVKTTDKNVEKTKKFIPIAEALKSTQEVVNLLEKEVFPIISHLLEISEEKIKYNFSPKQRKILSAGRTCSRVEEQNIGTSIPYLWKKGNYSSIKDSVTSEISQLKKMLSVIKQKDLVKSWERKRKTGSLDLKRVHRFPAKQFDFFKKKNQTIDRTKNFCFSLIVDVSGSMVSDDRGINALRGVIIFCEVFKALDIPLEIITFGISAEKIKSFDEKISLKVKDDLSFIARPFSPHNRLSLGLEKSSILSRPEKNKYSVVITDGGFTDEMNYRSKAIIRAKQLEQKGLNILGIDLSDELKETIKPENVKEIKKVDDLPLAFTTLLKNIIKKI